MNKERLGESLLRAFEKVPDPRSTHGRRHPLSAILALSVCAMVSGARSLYAIAQWGRMQEPAVLKELGFTRDRTPAVSTLHKVFSSMDTDAFESVLGEWIESRLGPGKEAIAVDGKALRGIHGDQDIGYPIKTKKSDTHGQWDCHPVDCSGRQRASPWSSNPL